MSSHDQGTRDRALLRALAAGHQQALAELYDRHSAPLFRHAIALARHRTDAEDLVHAVFVKVAGLGADLLGVREPAGYLHRMLHTTWIDLHRRSRVATRTAVGPAISADHSPAHEVALDMARALDLLPTEQREVVVLHVIEGFSYREIGRMTGVSLFTAAARYRLGVARLRRALTPQGRTS